MPLIRTHAPPVLPWPCKPVVYVFPFVPAAKTWMVGPSPP